MYTSTHKLQVIAMHGHEFYFYLHCIYVYLEECFIYHINTLNLVLINATLIQVHTVALLHLFTTWTTKILTYDNSM